MAKCISCGKEVREGRTVCSDCRFKLREAEDLYDSVCDALFGVFQVDIKGEDTEVKEALCEAEEALSDVREWLVHEINTMRDAQTGGERIRIED